LQLQEDIRVRLNMKHAEDKHVKFYEENLKEREITWKTDMKG
jgi:hypothetical protein